MMGFWNVTAKDLRHGDEIRMPTILGDQYPKVRDVDTGGASGRIAVCLDLDSEVNAMAGVWIDLAPDDKLVVRR